MLYWGSYSKSRPFGEKGSDNLAAYDWWREKKIKKKADQIWRVTDLRVFKSKPFFWWQNSRLAFFWILRICKVVVTILGIITIAKKKKNLTEPTVWLMSNTSGKAVQNKGLENKIYIYTRWWWWWYIVFCLIYCWLCCCCWLATF